MEPRRAASDWLSPGQWLERHAGRDPQRLAVVDVDRGLGIRFGELAAVVDGVALQLREHGVARGHRVVLIIDGGIETVVMWLALWRLAAVVCPFDISQIGATATQTAFNTLGPVLLLHGQRLGEADLPPGMGPRLRFGQWPPLPGELASVRLAPADRAPHRLAALRGAGPQAGDVAAACCTSGSTGRMKIVLHDHASYALNGRASAHLLDLREHDHLLDYRSFSWYSPQILSLMPFLQLGLTLHLARQFSASRFPEWIARHGITVAAGVPTVLNILLGHPLERLRASSASLRVMSSSSAPLAASTWARFERETGIPIINLYGSSEGGWICGNRREDRRIGSVGRPVPGMDVRVLDAQGRPCADGEPGEVVIDGAKLALGTLQPDGRLHAIRGQAFRTRDLAVREADGVLRLLGRMDDLVIRGGVKIAPGEVEDALLAHPGVAEAAAVGVPDAIYGQAVVAFVVPREGAALDPAGLQAHAAQALPRAKRPLAVCVIDALPRNARGKLRPDALAALWREMVGEGEGRA